MGREGQQTRSHLLPLRETRGLSPAPHAHTQQFKGNKRDQDRETPGEKSSLWGEAEMPVLTHRLRIA